MSSIRMQLEKLDVKIAEFQQVVDIEGVGAAPIDLEIDESYFIEETVVEGSLDIEDVEPEVVVAPEVIAEAQVEPVVEAPVEPVAEPEVESEAEPEEDLPLFAEPESIFEVAQKSPKATRAVIDVMEDKQAWRTDMPGAPVKDLLSAISLNDRVQFINVLFNEDPAAFQQARARINMMETLDEVIEYITAEFDWDLNSQVVYRFMMAVRRKVK